MSWSEEEQLQYLLRLPWAILYETTSEGERLVRAIELPWAVGRGETPEARDADLCRSLRATLTVYLRLGDPIPLPATVRSLPWQKGPPAVAATTTYSTATLNLFAFVPASPA